MNPVVVANCSAFWGDDPSGARRQVEGGPIDYLVGDYLAELTMAILHKQRLRNPDAGYAHDFVTHLREVLPACVERGITVISNAGGVNPLACKAAIERVAADLGIADQVQVGVVLGDALDDRLDELANSLGHLENGRPFADIRDRVLSANAYLGAAPIVRSLELGANVVVTGRVTDSALTLAPLIHEFGWAADDWDRLAAGIIAGHVIECGKQCTGGNFTDWQTVKNTAQLGFPLAEVHTDGSFVVTKHPGTGGLVSVHTVTEQLLYEIGSPRYLTPDCVARFDTLQVTSDGPDRVLVQGARGEPAPADYKVSVNWANGYRAFGRLVVSGPDALAKARHVAEIFWEIAGGEDSYEETHTSFVGWNVSHPPLAGDEPGELMVQLAVRDPDKARINRNFGVEVVPRVIDTVPGIFYPADQGRPRASEVVAFWPALIRRDLVPVRVRVGDDEVDVDILTPPPADSGRVDLPAFAAVPIPYTGRHLTVPLLRLCLARAGDKGDLSNIGVIARTPAIYTWMRDALTPEFIADRFAALCRGAVERYELPNLLSLNFVLRDSLGGGATSLRADAQGKTYAQFLLATDVEIDAGLLDALD